YRDWSSDVCSSDLVLLALGVGVCDKGGVFEPSRLAENGSRDVDVVIECEHVDQVRRGVCDWRQTVRQLGAHLSLDGAEEAYHDVIEYADLLFGIARCAAHEQLGDAREHLDTARIGAGRQGGFELGDEGKSLHDATGAATPLRCRNNAARTVNKALRRSYGASRQR